MEEIQTQEIIKKNKAIQIAIFTERNSPQVDAFFKQLLHENYFSFTFALENTGILRKHSRYAQAFTRVNKESGIGDYMRRLW